jgi:hypothetical protein
MTIKAGSYIVVKQYHLLRNQRGVVIQVYKSNDKDVLQIRWDTPSSSMPDNILKRYVSVCKDTTTDRHQSTPIRSPRSSTQRLVDNTIQRTREVDRRRNGNNTIQSADAVNVDAAKYEV